MSTAATEKPESLQYHSSLSASETCSVGGLQLGVTRTKSNVVAMVQ